jgi:hypothetical protein
MTKLPPVPPESRNPHEAEISPSGNPADKIDRESKNPDKHGQQANTRQNITHQGYQQDR